MRRTNHREAGCQFLDEVGGMDRERETDAGGRAQAFALAHGGSRWVQDFLVELVERGLDGSNVVPFSTAPGDKPGRKRTRIGVEQRTVCGSGQTWTP